MRSHHDSLFKICDCMQVIPFNAHQELHLERGCLWRVYGFPLCTALPFCQFLVGLSWCCVVHLPAMSSKGEGLQHRVPPCTTWTKKQACICLACFSVHVVHGGIQFSCLRDVTSSILRTPSILSTLPRFERVIRAY